MKILKPAEAGPGPALRLTLGDSNPDVAAALADAFRGAGAVSVVEGDLLDMDCQAVVSPANSFGDMGGGIDKAIDDHLGGEAQRCVRAAIAERFLGELPVGAALVVVVRRGRMGTVVAAPTMRVPGRVGGTLNAYLAMRAALVAVIVHNSTAPEPVRSLAVPGLCTGVGGMPCAEAAGQLRAAYDNVIGGGWRRVAHPAMAPYPLHEPGGGRR